MITNRRILLFLGIALSTQVFPASAVWAARVAADARLPVITAVPGGGATLDLVAYSEQPPLGVNLATQDILFGAAPVPAPVLPGDDICVGCIHVFGFKIPTPFSRIYAPPVGFRGAPKPATSRKVRSTTGTAIGEAEYFAPGFLGPGDPGRLQAFGFVSPGSLGRAAGEAIDPFVVAPGIYSYSYFINELVLEIEEQNEFSGATFFATDSRFTNQPLWSLSIDAQGILESESDLFIDFVSNPILGLSNTNIEALVRGAFNVSAGVASLTEFTLFSTTYSVNQEIIFSEGLNAGVESVPEPTFALSLLALGTLGAASTLSSTLSILKWRKGSKIRKALFDLS